MPATIEQPNATPATLDSPDPIASAVETAMRDSGVKLSEAQRSRITESVRSNLSGNPVKVKPNFTADDIPQMSKANIIGGMRDAMAPTEPALSGRAHDAQLIGWFDLTQSMYGSVSKTVPPAPGEGLHSVLGVVARIPCPKQKVTERFVCWTPPALLAKPHDEHEKTKGRFNRLNQGLPHPSRLVKAIENPSA